MIKRRLFILAASVAALALVANLEIFAQKRARPTAERRLHPGRGFWANKAASRRIDHALDYSRGLYEYAQQAQTIDPAEARVQAEELSRNLDAAKKRLDEARKEAEAEKDSETVVDIDSINKHVFAASKQHEKCMAECKKKEVNGESVMHCCQTITSSLGDAKKEHSRVMKRLHPGTGAAKPKTK